MSPREPPLPTGLKSDGFSFNIPFLIATYFLAENWAELQYPFTKASALDMLHDIQDGKIYKKEDSLLTLNMLA